MSHPALTRQDHQSALFFVIDSNHIYWDTLPEKSGNPVNSLTLSHSIFQHIFYTCRRLKDAVNLDRLNRFIRYFRGDIIV